MEKDRLRHKAKELKKTMKISENNTHKKCRCQLNSGLLHMTFFPGAAPPLFSCLPEPPCSHVSLFARTAFVAREPHTEIEIEMWQNTDEKSKKRWRFQRIIFTRNVNLILDYSTWPFSGAAAPPLSSEPPLFSTFHFFPPEPPYFVVARTTLFHVSLFARTPLFSRFHCFPEPLLFSCLPSLFSPNHTTFHCSVPTFHCLPEPPLFPEPL